MFNMWNFHDPSSNLTNDNKGKTRPHPNKIKITKNGYKDKYKDKAKNIDEDKDTGCKYKHKCTYENKDAKADKDEEKDKIEMKIRHNR